MAFKILNNEELSLLDDSQRVQYERNLERHQQRIAFVEKMEALENTYIEPYQPELAPITVVNEFEVKPFKREKYTVNINEKVEKPELNISALKKIDRNNPIIPLVPECTNFSMNHINKIEKKEKEQMNIPIVRNPRSVVSVFRPLKWQCVSMPEVSNPTIKRDLSMKELKNNLLYNPVNMPKVMMADINIDPVNILKREQVDLPEIAICTIAAAKYTKPEKCNPKLPEVNIQRVNICYSGKVKSNEPTLPEISAFSSLPQVTFYKPEYKNPVLPQISNVEIKPRNYRKVKADKPEIPNISDVRIVRRNFQKPESVPINIITPTVVNLKVKTYVNSKGNISELPKVPIREAPNAYDKLKDLFFTSNEKTRALKG